VCDLSEKERVRGVRRRAREHEGGVQRCTHELVPSVSEGWFACRCGYAIGVCHDCVPGVSRAIPLCLCEEHRLARRVGRYWQVPQESLDRG